MVGALAGVLLVVLAAAVGSFPLLLVAFGLIGAAQAANLQTRFAAADLATDATRGRDLSLVVWATTIGAVLGPNLTGPGEALGQAVGMPPLTGPFLFTIGRSAAGDRPVPHLAASGPAAARTAGDEARDARRRSRDRETRPADGRAICDLRGRGLARR